MYDQGLLNSDESNVDTIAAEAAIRYIGTAMVAIRFGTDVYLIRSARHMGQVL